MDFAHGTAGIPYAYAIELRDRGEQRDRVSPPTHTCYCYDCPCGASAYTNTRIIWFP